MKRNKVKNIKHFFSDVEQDDVIFGIGYNVKQPLRKMVTASCSDSCFNKLGYMPIPIFNEQ